jgi:hypothetical protein
MCPERRHERTKRCLFIVSQVSRFADFAPCSSGPGRHQSNEARARRGGKGGRQVFSGAHFVAQAGLGGVGVLSYALDVFAREALTIGGSPHSRKGKGNMKRVSSFASKLLVVCVVLSALVVPVSASKPEEVVLTFDLVITAPDSAVGTFVATGAIEDNGSVDETFRWTDDGNLQGTMVLTSAEGVGTITLRFHLTPIGGPPVVPSVGGFVLESGTGAYENIHGVGSAESNTYVAAPPYTIGATFSGKVHVDP